ncbi:MAG TPA: HlyD family efflux transporter periplasmic adaptor subunit [Acidimicrobiia bacterium]|nr:HlyD family efflux transporter periplasmic adaptor subunit [Acidimicrobiia bacterium]
MGSGAGAGSGGSSASSSALVTIDTVRRLEVVSGFPEADATKLAAGQPATITFPALPETEVAGKVVAVSTTSTVVSNVVTYNAVISFDSVPAQVKPGMTANVSVITASKDNVVEVPSAAISSSGGQSTVTVRVGGKDQTVPVVTGLKGDGTTEITSGLSDGDQVVMSVGVVSSNANRGSSGNQTQTRTGTFGGGGGLGGGFGGGGFGGGGGGFGGRG